MTRVLFVCSQNKLRSPTAEQVFSDRAGVEVTSAGLNNDAVTPLTPELVEWADVIFVMDQGHRKKLSKHFREQLDDKSVICLGIPDNYDFMAPELVEILEDRVPQHLPALGAGKRMRP